MANQDIFEVEGGLKLYGDITPQGAKNEALQILSAVLLSEETIEISNIPDILDVNLLIELLADMGVEVSKISTDTYSFNAKNVEPDILLSDKFKTKASHLRGSVMI
ncbi:MAG TPA: UDP-N-acetylglucosamine 1-carboxyvinyltransferase, partial [Chitinophagales bacterium]|nr:UDP-N-acetylglucosamine 1-carboxyvinyltransferase [Chitinophagales bacterium]